MRAASRGAGWSGMGVSPRIPGRGAATTLSVADVDAIAKEISGIRYRAAGVSETAVMSFASARLFGRLQGTDVEYAPMRALTMRSGRFFSETDVSERKPVIVLSAEAARKLIGARDDAIGETDSDSRSIVRAHRRRDTPARIRGGERPRRSVPALHDGSGSAPHVTSSERRGLRRLGGRIGSRRPRHHHAPARDAIISARTIPTTSPSALKRRRRSAAKASIRCSLAQSPAAW